MATMKFVISHDELQKIMDSAETIDGAKKLVQLEFNPAEVSVTGEATLHATNLLKLSSGIFQESGLKKPTCPNPPCNCC